MTHNVSRVMGVLALAVVSLVAVLAFQAERAETAFPGDNGKIVFDSDRDGNREIYVMNADGTGQENLTLNDWPTDRSAAWSPDGSKIAFMSNRGLVEDIFVMNADGTGEESLTDSPATLSSDAPAWSPDGDKIAYQSGTGASGLRDIYVMNADGTGQAPLTATGKERNPDWQAAGVAPGGPCGGKSVAWGDHNCSGSTDPVDSLLTLRYDAGLSTNTGDCPDFGVVVEVVNASFHLWGDVDCSGAVNPVDSLKLLRFDAGLSVTQAAGCPTLGSQVSVTE